MKDLKMMFEGSEVKIIVNEKSEPLFELYSTGKALGYSRTDGKTYITIENANSDHDGQKILKSFPRKDRIDKTIKNAEITPVVHDGQKYLTEEQLYDFMLEARTEKCKPFRKWVTSEVLPTMRKTGAYIMEGREEEMINNYFPSFSDDIKLAMVQDLLKQNKELKVSADKYKEFMDEDGTFGFRELCKHLNGLGFNLKESELRENLKEKNIICKQGKKYVVTQDAIRNGYGRIKDKIVDGTNRCTSRYTEKLRDLLVKELNN